MESRPLLHMPSCVRSPRKGLCITPVGGILFCAILLFTAIVGNLLIQIPLLPLLLVYPVGYLWASSFMGGTWYCFVAAILEYILGIKYVYSGLEELSRDDRMLVISNHRTRLDWLFLWAFFSRYGRGVRHKVVLKSPIRKIPGLGWCTQCLCYLFLQRSWQADEKHVNKWIGVHTAIDYPLNLLLFPEGTDLTANSLARSHAYSERNNIESYDYVLQPRVKGLWALLDGLREHIDRVVDLTIAYPRGLPQTELHLAAGSFPAEIHVDCKVFDISEAPLKETEAAQWCQELWKAKEAKLNTLYAAADQDIAAGEPIRGFPGAKMPVTPISREYVVCLLFWTAMGGVGVWLFLCYSAFRWYALSATLVYFVTDLMGLNLDRAIVLACYIQASIFGSGETDTKS